MLRRRNHRDPMDMLPTRFDPSRMIAGFRTPVGRLRALQRRCRTHRRPPSSAKVPQFLEGRDRAGSPPGTRCIHAPTPSAGPGSDGAKALGGRSQEIQRLVGRALRAAVHMGQARHPHNHNRLRRTRGRRRHRRRWSTGGFVALAGALKKIARALREPVAATNVELTVRAVSLLDLFIEDSRLSI